MGKIFEHYIFINNMPLKDNPSCIRILLMDTEGKALREVEEKALISDKNFRDLFGLYIGMKEALKFKFRRILILTNNSLLGAIIKTDFRMHCTEDYGLYPNIKRLSDNFKKIEVRVVP